jgi:hypothetical protein
MAKITGYDGGDGEEQLIAALRQAVAEEEGGTWDKIRTKYMQIGSIVDICVAKGYVKASRLGFVGYFRTKVGYAETTCRDCLKCWQKRRDFDRVHEWVKSNNCFKPAKASGPILFLDSHKAWSERLCPGAAKKRPPKKLTAKELRQLVQAYRSMLDRVGGEHVKQAEINQFETRVWNTIVQERAALESELGESKSDAEFPVTTTRSQESDEPDNDGVAEEEQHQVRTIPPPAK